MLCAHCPTALHRHRAPGECVRLVYVHCTAVHGVALHHVTVFGRGLSVAAHANVGTLWYALLLHDFWRGVGDCGSAGFKRWGLPGNNPTDCAHSETSCCIRTWN